MNLNGIYMKLQAISFIIITIIYDIFIIIYSDLHIHHYGIYMTGQIIIINLIILFI